MNWEYSSFRRWRDNLLPRHIPEDIRNIFWLSVYAVVALILLCLVRVYGFLAGPWEHEMKGALLDMALWILLALVAILVAYGIRAERVYPRGIAIVVLLFVLFRSTWNFLAKATDGDYAISAIVAFLLLRRLLFQGDVEAYYMRLQQSEGIDKKRRLAVEETPHALAPVEVKQS